MFNILQARFIINIKSQINLSLFVKMSSLLIPLIMAIAIFFFFRAMAQKFKSINLLAKRIISPRTPNGIWKKIQQYL